MGGINGGGLENVLKIIIRGVKQWGWEDGK